MFSDTGEKSTHNDFKRMPLTYGFTTSYVLTDSTDCRDKGVT